MTMSITPKVLKDSPLLGNQNNYQGQQADKFNNSPSSKHESPGHGSFPFPPREKGRDVVSPFPRGRRVGMLFLPSP